MAPLPELRVAILKNYSMPGKGGQMMLDSLANLSHKPRSSAQVEVYAPIEGGPLPDPNQYDLIILTGGLFNLLEKNQPAWVVDTLNLIKAVACNDGPRKPKLLGLCWGQQATALALGGSLAESERGPCVIYPSLETNCK